MRRRLLLLCLIMAVLAPSCLRYEQAVKVDDNGDMRFETVFDVDIEDALPILRSEYGPDLPDDAEGFLCDSVAMAGSGYFNTSDTDIERFNDDGFCGVRTSMDFGGAGRSDLSVALTTALESPSSLVKDGDIWDFSGTFNPRSLTDYSIGNDELVKPQLREEATVTFRLELPGVAIDGRHNADEVDGGTFL